MEKDRIRPGAAVRSECFFAIRREAAALAGEANQPFKVADLPVTCLDAQVVAHVRENRACFAAFVFGVAIVRVA